MYTLNIDIQMKYGMRVLGMLSEDEEDEWLRAAKEPN